MKKYIEKILLKHITYIVNVNGAPITGITTKNIPSISEEIVNFISSKTLIIDNESNELENKKESEVALPCGVCGGTGKANIDYGNDVMKYYKDNDEGTGQ